MKLKSLPFLAAFFVATAFVVGCGDQKDSRLSDADVAYLKQQRINQLYGSSTTTSTSTVVQYVTITNTTTVSH